jgi:hypothetical protein
MMRFLVLAISLFTLGTSPATCADEPGKEGRLPEPLEKVVCDFGPLAAHFKVVEAKLHPANSFTVGGRIVAEETIVWTLEAREDLKGVDVYKMLHPGPAPSPFLKVRFLRMVDGKDEPADARPKGYLLGREVRWIDPKKASDLPKGARMDVWAHLGKEGTAGLIAQQASKLVVATK